MQIYRVLKIHVARILEETVISMGSIVQMCWTLCLKFFRPFPHGDMTAAAAPLILLIKQDERNGSRQSQWTTNGISVGRAVSHWHPYLQGTLEKKLYYISNL